MFHWTIRIPDAPKCPEVYYGSISAGFDPDTKNSNGWIVMKFFWRRSCSPLLWIFSSSKVWNVVLSGAFLGHDDVTSLLTLHQSCIYRGHKAKQHFFFLFFLIIWLLFGPKSKRRRKHRNSLEWCISKSLWPIGLFIFALMRPRCSKVLLLHTFKPGITRTTLPLTDTPSIT